MGLSLPNNPFENVRFVDATQFLIEGERYLWSLKSFSFKNEDRKCWCTFVWETEILDEGEVYPAKVVETLDLNNSKLEWRFKEIFSALQVLDSSGRLGVEPNELAGRECEATFTRYESKTRPGEFYPQLKGLQSI
jgi:hypothetical protein